jgi:hypothetical protein
MSNLSNLSGNGPHSADGGSSGAAGQLSGNMIGENRDNAPQAALQAGSPVRELGNQNSGGNFAVQAHQGGSHSKEPLRSSSSSRSPRPFTKKCYLCQKVGHKQADCPEKGKRKPRGPPKYAREPSKPSEVQAQYQDMQAQIQALKDVKKEIEDDGDSSESEDEEEISGPRSLTDVPEISPFTVEIERASYTWGELYNRSLFASGLTTSILCTAGAIMSYKIVPPGDYRNVLTSWYGGAAASGVFLLGTVHARLRDQPIEDELAFLLRGDKLVKHYIDFQPVYDRDVECTIYDPEGNPWDCRYIRAKLEELRYQPQLRFGVITEYEPADDLIKNFWSTLNLGHKVTQREVVYSRELVSELLGPMWRRSKQTLAEYSSTIDAATPLNLHINLPRGGPISNLELCEGSKMVAKLLFMREQQARVPFFRLDSSGIPKYESRSGEQRGPPRV